MGLGKVMRVMPGGSVAAYADGSPAGTMRVPNYPVFDAGGVLYVSDSGSWDAEDGLIWRVLPGGEAQLFTRGVHRFPNGMALNAAGDWLYVVESTRPGVVRVGIGSDGSAGAVEVVVELPRTVPDGLAFDAAGNLYISCYQPNRLYRLSPSSQLEIIADDWTGQILAMPTNLAFFGSALDRLAVASLGGRTLRAAAVGVRGLALRYPDLGSGSTA
jgi:gluconolactonase